MAALDRNAIDALPDGATIFAVVVYTDHDGTRYLMHGGRTTLRVDVQDGFKFLTFEPDTTGGCFDLEHLFGKTFQQGEDWRATFYDEAADAREDFDAELARGAVTGPLLSGSLLGSDKFVETFTEFID